MDKGIALYIHIPFCKSKCSYCDFFSRPGIENLIDSYVDSLCNELSFYSFSGKKIFLKSLYIGGGTPSLLSILQLSKLFSALKNNFIFDSQIEATIELNPDDITEELVQFLENSFINRISLGIQSLKNDTLRRMCRRASRETSLNALNIIQSHFTKRFTADLIAGFPGEDENSLIENIHELVEYHPEHISLYSLCVEEETELYKQIEEEKLFFDQNESDELWLTAKRELEKNGFYQYEVSNFAKTEKAFSRHNLTYWHLSNYLGAGAGAAGSLFYKSENSIRYTNDSDIEKYILFWKDKKNYGADIESYAQTVSSLKKNPCSLEVIDKETEEFEFFMMGFRLREGISEKEYNSRFNKNLTERLGVKNGIFREWIDKGYAQVISVNKNGFDDKYYSLTEKGILFLNVFLEKLSG